MAIILLSILLLLFVCHFTHSSANWHLHHHTCEHSTNTNMHADNFIGHFYEVHLILVQYNTNAQLKNNKPLNLNALYQLTDTILMRTLWTKAMAKCFSLLFCPIHRCASMWEWRWKIKGSTVDKVYIEELRWISMAWVLGSGKLLSTEKQRIWRTF